MQLLGGANICAVDYLANAIIELARGYRTTHAQPVGYRNRAARTKRITQFALRVCASERASFMFAVRNIQSSLSVHNYIDRIA